MKTYGRRFVRRSISRAQNLRTETRDGVLWTIDWANRICNIKIQGSNELITAHFPQNEAKKMSYMREGNAVRVVHRGGIRGYLEVTGHGMAIPTPVAGDFHPDVSDLPDGVSEGCQIIPTKPPSLCVTILDGYYRLNGTLYSLSGGASGYEAMADDSGVTMHPAYPPMDMGDTGDYVTMTDDSSSGDVVMNSVFPLMTLGDPIDDYCLDPMPTGNKFRYDAFVVGEDGIIDYIVGSEASSNPSKPEIPDNHVLIGQYILLWTGLTEITGRNIGMEWEEPYASGVLFTCVDELEWNESNPSPQANVTLTVINQYEWTISGNYNIVLAMPRGTGSIWSLQSGWDDAQVSQEITGTSYTFVYQRLQWVELGELQIQLTETSPFFVGTVYDQSGMILATSYHRLVLLSVGGLEIEGGQVNDILLPERPQYILPDSEGNADVESWDDGYQIIIEASQDISINFPYTAPADRAKIILLIEQDETGGWVPTLPMSDIEIAEEVLEDSSGLAINTDANSRTYLGFIYHESDSKYDLVAKATILKS